MDGRVARRFTRARILGLTFASLVGVAAAGPAAAQPAPDGEAVYEEHCASCHEGTLPRMPSRDALREFTPEYVEVALSSFSMRREGAMLDAAERRAVSAFVTGTPPDTYRAPLEVIPREAFCGRGAGAGALTGAAWNGWGGGLDNRRFQDSDAAGLSASDVPRLRVKWAFGFPGVSASGSQVTIAGDRVFVGSRNGMVYALDRATGCIAWTFEADAGVRSTPVLDAATDGAPAIYFADAYAQVYSLDGATGTLRWKVKVEDHPDAMVTGGVALFEDRVYVPVASLEEGTAVIPSYQCCTFRGSVVALDTATGRQVWKTFTIDDPARPTTRNAAGTQLMGPSGVGVWSTPVVDPASNRLYVTTGDSYSNPPAPWSDSILALALDTGRVLWTRQALVGDAWNTGCLAEPGSGRANCPDEAGPDYDFGSAAALVTLADGRRVLLAGQKSGQLYGVDPDTGDLLWETQVGEGGVLGGIEWGFATDGPVAYVALSNAFEKPAGEAGGLVAVNVADGSMRWTSPPPADGCAGRVGCNTGQPGAVTAMPGIVFSGSLDGHMRAHESETGRVIWDMDTGQSFDTVNGVPASGGSINGPGVTVAGGTVLFSSGYGSLGFMSGNVLLAFTVEGE